MKIVKVNIREFCGLTFEGNFDGSVVLLKGENGRRKSTIMRFIEIALGKSTNIPPNATGDGEVITTKNGEQYVFKVDFDKKGKEGKAVLKVQKPDGLFDTTKGAIRDIVGALDFNINEFVEYSKSESGRKLQVKEFRSRLPKEILDGLSTWEKDTVACEEERTDIGRDVKKATGALESHPLYNSLVWKMDKHMLKYTLNGKLNDYSFEDFTKTDISAEFETLKALQEHNQYFDRASDRRAIIGTDWQKKQNEIKELEEKLATAKKELAEIDNKIIEADKWLNDKKNQKAEITALENKIEDAETTNALYDQVQSLKKHITDKETAEANYGELTARIEGNRESIKLTIQEQTELIMEGMSFDENNLLYKGIPVHPDCMSTSEIMELGMRMKYLENPEAPLFIENTNVIGADRWATMLAFAKEHNLQVIGEEVVRGQDKLTVEISAA